MSDRLTRIAEALAAYRIARDRFHAHLDSCGHCQAHPFALCLEGARFLRATADVADSPIEAR